MGGGLHEVGRGDGRGCLLPTPQKDEVLPFVFPVVGQLSSATPDAHIYGSRPSGVNRAALSSHPLSATSRGVSVSQRRTYPSPYRDVVATGRPCRQSTSSVSAVSRRRGSFATLSERVSMTSPERPT